MRVYGEQYVIMDSETQQQESSADLSVSGTFRLVMFIYEEDIDTIIMMCAQELTSCLPRDMKTNKKLNCVASVVSHKPYIQGLHSIMNKSSPGDEILERDVTYHPICLLVYH